MRETRKETVRWIFVSLVTYSGWLMKIVNTYYNRLCLLFSVQISQGDVQNYIQNVNLLLLFGGIPLTLNIVSVKG